jgi:ADP-dependent NAD(P)H-hydrate dehydratase / NAD(P)H-hydrate epimerase
VKIVSVAEMRALEAAAFASGVSEAELQQRAGTAVAEEVFALVGADRILVLAGHGNNGRDGMVAAVWLLERGCQVDLALGPRHAMSEAELQRVRDLGGQVFAAGADLPLAEARVVVDALAGIGTHGALREPLAGLVRVLNAASRDRVVVSVDVPSGMNADTGEVPGDVVWADVTVTLGAVKQGLLRFPAAERVGELVCRDIGLSSSDLPYDVLLPAELEECVPRRPLDAHKYRFGRVLVVAGSEQFVGAPVLSVGGALRAGAGLVTLASTPAARQAVVAHLPEATYTQGDPRRVEDLPLASQAAIVVGPGLGRDPSTIRFVHDLLRAVHDNPVVIDADALYALSELDHWWEALGPNAVLTPHSGELSRLGADLQEGETAWAQASRLAQAWGCYLIAKGPFTCVASPEGRVAVWPTANAALATGGTGDVLAGLCAGLLAQGAPPWDAARVAVAAHALAASTIIEDREWRTLLASDLLAELPAALARLARISF